MLIELSVENWMSFRDRTTLSLVATKEKQHGERIPKVAFGLRVLPTAVIYGGNASGKTNLFRALEFVSELVTRGTTTENELILVDQFRLDPNSATSPSTFSVTLLADESIYRFSFTATATKIHTEELVRVLANKEAILYTRKDDEFKFGESLGKPERDLKQVALGTRGNQLFLTNSVSQRVETFRAVYEWFENKLKLVFPDSLFAGTEMFLDKDHALHHALNDILPQLDTGIVEIDGVEIPYSDIIIEEPARSMFTKSIRQGEKMNFRSKDGDRIMCSLIDGEISAKKLVTMHSDSQGSKVRFSIAQESDGTRRLIDLIPAFVGVSRTNGAVIFAIDELDRSLHSLLTIALIKMFLSSCTETSRNQLLFTTHNLTLMDQELFRRDELWVTERNPTGASGLIAFSEYKDIRKDKDIRKSYLQGRMGGIPNIRAALVRTNDDQPLLEAIRD